MLYKFKSRAAGDLVMLGPQGDALMRVLGREPATRGIFEVAHLPALVARLEAAVAEAEARSAASPGGAPGDAPDGGDAEAGGPAVGLRQRAWPLIEMMRRCHAAGEPIVWGV